jgi:hypothetical protein
MRHDQGSLVLAPVQTRQGAFRCATLLALTRLNWRALPVVARRLVGAVERGSQAPRLSRMQRAEALARRAGL